MPAKKKETVDTKVKKAAKPAVKGTVSAKQAQDNATAARIEAKKAVRSAGRKVKEGIAAGKVKAEDVNEAVVAHKIEGKKQAAKATRAVKDTASKVKASVKAPAKKLAAAKLELVIQSPMGGAITTEQIIAKLPKDTTNVYVRVDQNKLYYVLKNGETGSVDIW